MTTEACNRALVIWQDPAEESGLPEPAILLHEDDGATIIAEQEGRYLTFTTSGALEFAKQLRAMVKAKKEAAG